MKDKLSAIKGDFFGAIIATIIALPQCLAFGVASGLGACSGLWGAIILSFFSGCSGGNLPFVSGPTGPVTIIIAIIITNLQGSLPDIILVFLMAAVFQILISFTQIPNMIKYVPYPVISGFLTGIGLIIIILQLSPMLGGGIYSSTIEALGSYPSLLMNINKEAFLLGAMTLAILFFTPKKITGFVPCALLALVIMTGICCYFGFDVERVSQIEAVLPKIHFLNFSFDTISKNIPSALTLAFIATSEGLLTGIIMDSLTKKRHDSRRLVLSQGIGNFLCAISGSMYGTAATMRSVAAVKAGASGRLAPIFSALIMTLILFKFTGFISQVPICVLAAILIKIGYDILDLKVVKILKYAPKDDLYVLIGVLLLTVFYNLIFALGAGIVLAALLYAKRIADSTNLKVNDYNPSDYTSFETKVEKDSHYKIRILHIDGQFFFGSITQIVSHFDQMLETEYIILNYSSSAKLDMSAIFALEDIIFRLLDQKIKLFLVVGNKEVYEQIQSLEIISQIGEESLFYDETAAIEKAIEKTHTAK